MTDEIAAIGHNNPPIVPEEITAKAKDFNEAAKAWLDLKVIDSQERAEKATDFIDGARKTFKLIDTARKDAKKPHDDAGKAVQDAFNPLLEAITRAADGVKAMTAVWLKKENDRVAAENAAAAKKAAEEKAEADRLAAEAAASNDIAAQVEAEAAQKAAEAAQKAASKVEKVGAASSTGAGRKVSLRKHYTCTVDKIGPALSYYREHPDVIALIERLATAEVRGQDGEKVAPQGFKLHVEEKAA